jgi:outer membrane receptor protein involved in Fe transport
VLAQERAQSLADLSIEDLMNESVTSVSKRQTRLGDAATAIAVITQDDIRRSGYNSVPELLRLVPGLDVARINSNEWAITSRGFNNQYANKLLVMIDGRTVYTPTSAGVYWNAQDMMLEDVDRIEVIRGPGATLWGANAVNGVINIISKAARDTQGTLISTAVGTEDQPSIGTRYGGQLGSDVQYRTYIKYFNRQSFVEAGGNGAPLVFEHVAAHDPVLLPAPSREPWIWCGASGYLRSRRTASCSARRAQRCGLGRRLPVHDSAGNAYFQSGLDTGNGPPALVPDIRTGRDRTGAGAMASGAWHQAGAQRSDRPGSGT